MDNTRITRIPLPIDLIRQMDEAIIAGTGGYMTRTELIVDAIRERLLELGHEEAPPFDTSPLDSARPSSTESGGTPIVHLTIADVGLPPDQPIPAPTDLMSLGGVESTTTIAPDQDISRPEEGPLFGLHNRDYPSLWALRALAVMCVNDPVPLDQFWRVILPQAWEHGDRLIAYEKATGVKSTALFPTNRSKTKSAETGFRVFAVGSIDEEEDDGGSIATGGPLFEWRVAGLTRGDRGELLIGPTPAGWDLLQQCSTITVIEPHPADTAQAFLTHLAIHAAADRHALGVVLGVLTNENADRRTLLEHVARTWPSWSESQVSTNSAGYIARAREWGLVEPKQVDGSYRLTELGQRLQASHSNNATTGEPS